MSGQETPPRLGYEAIELSRVTSGSAVQYTSRYPAWRPRVDLPDGVPEQPTKTKTNQKTTTGVFGGLVYAQAPLAAARAVEYDERQSQKSRQGYMGIHVGICERAETEGKKLTGTVHSRRFYAGRPRRPAFCTRGDASALGQLLCNPARANETARAALGPRRWAI